MKSRTFLLLLYTILNDKIFKNEKQVTLKKNMFKTKRTYRLLSKYIKLRNI